MVSITGFKRLNALKNKEMYGYMLAGTSLIIGTIFNQLSFLFYFAIAFLGWKNHKKELDEIQLYYFIMPYSIIIGFSVWNYGVAHFVAVVIGILIAIVFSKVMKGLINYIDIKFGIIFLLPITFFTLSYSFDKLPALNVIEIPSILAPIYNHTPILRIASVIGVYLTIFTIVLLINSIIGLILDKSNTKIYKAIIAIIILLIISSNVLSTGDMLVIEESKPINVAAIQGDVVSVEGRPLVLGERFDFDFNHYKNMLSNVEADIFVFPQVPLGIYDIENRADHLYRQRLISLANEKNGILVGLLIESSSIYGGKRHKFISAYLVSPEGFIGKSSKRNLNFFTQSIIFSQSDNYSTVFSDYGELGVTISDDIRDLNTVRLLKKNGAEVILSTSNDDNFGVTFPANYNLFPVINAIQYNIPVVVANQDGTSMVVDKSGKIISQLDVKEKGVLVNEVKVQKTISIYSLFGRYLELLLAIFIAVLVIKSIRRYYF
ncbi:carbon-nitrogen hydrolase family protein [Alkaliphilus pronyensis]|nr:carbon-nitrogen hydrolase family protein [Alkaliphilus pronyensis]